MARSIWYLMFTTFLIVSTTVQAVACPFCTAQAQTFTEEMESMDCVVIAKLMALPPPVDSKDPDAAIARAKFEVTDVVKGEKYVKPGTRIQALYYGEAELGTSFLVMAVVEGKDDSNNALVWSTPIKVTERSREYLTNLTKVAKDGPERLEYFQKHLEDKEELLARDAYDEFAKAPYETVKALRPKMNHDQLIAWITDTNLPATRRRLYLTMLGVCGGEKDLPFLEQLIRSEDKKAKAGLDALLGCYLTLKGSDGVDLVEEIYLKNRKAEYADTYAAIMALRFHGTEAQVIPVKRIVLALRTMLDRPELADLVIPDLARWEDWESLDRLVELYRKADDKSSWVRTPVVNFVKACPLPEAKDKLKELEKIDPAAVKRANMSFPFGPPKPPADAKTSSQVEPAKVESQFAAKPVLSSAATVAQAKSNPRAVGAVNLGAAPAAAIRKNSAQAANPWMLVGVAGLSGIVLLAVQWTVLVGRR